jgi:bacterioferritin
MSYITNITEIRARARQQIEQGPITKDYQLDLRRAVGLLNEALATEIVCTLRYRFHYFMATGIHSAAVADEFLEHANEEQEHADWVAERIKQLGGKPEMNPAVVAQTSHSEYKEGTSLADMIRENLVAERIAVESYREMVRFFGDGDPTSRILMERILAKEEEHADELADLLFAIEPHAGDQPRPLYFPDETPRTSRAGEEVTSESRH